MNEFKEALEKELEKQECPSCDSKDVGIDNWGMFSGAKDWFYFCKECDCTFNAKTPKLTQEERNYSPFS